MNAVLLDGRSLTHGALAEAFGFPDYYGRNLDALHDCLGEIAADTAVIILRAAEANEAGKRILQVLADSACENPRLRLFFAEEAI